MGMTDKKFEGLLLGLVGVGIALHYGGRYLDSLMKRKEEELPPRQSEGEIRRRLEEADAIDCESRGGVWDFSAHTCVAIPTERDTCFKQGGRWYPDVQMCQLPGQPPPPQQAPIPAELPPEVVPPPRDYLESIQAVDQPLTKEEVRKFLRPEIIERIGETIEIRETGIITPIQAPERFGYYWLIRDGQAQVGWSPAEFPAGPKTEVLAAGPYGYEREQAFIRQYLF